MLAKRIIPCLDIDKGRVVKGVRFKNIRDAGDPVDNAIFYNDEGADELVFLDITASHENRGTMAEIAAKIAREIFIPFTIGGGIRNLADIRAMLNAGADRVSINSAAVRNPEFIRESSRAFGSSTVVVAMDVKKIAAGKWNVFINGGRIDTGLDAIVWAKQAYSLGAGEILLTSMDRDGSRDGYDNEITSMIADQIRIPVIASGGAGKLEDFLEAFTVGHASAALAASLFHFREISIRQVKELLEKNHIPVRMDF